MIESLEQALNIAGDQDALVMDGFDDCIIGIASRCGCRDLVVYDFDKLMDKLQAQGMEYDEALEFYEFNMAGAWVGEGTPLVMERIQS